MKLEFQLGRDVLPMKLDERVLCKKCQGLISGGSQIIWKQEKNKLFAEHVKCPGHP